MPHIHSNSSSRPVIAALLLALASLALAACGSSSGGSSSSVAAARTSATGGAPGARSGRFTAIRECLQKNGITLPTPTPGQGHRPGGRFFGRGSLQLPKGVSRAQYEAAFKKCGASAFPRGASGLRSSPAFKRALTKFAACMRANGVNVPAPNTSGKGPIFNTKGLGVSNSKLNAAEGKCRGELTGAFRAGHAGPGIGG